MNTADWFSWSGEDFPVHCWQAGGKNSFKQNGRTLLDGIAATIINTRPDEDWLVVFQQGRDGGH
jgi:hypothetical protein